MLLAELEALAQMLSIAPPERSITVDLLSAAADNKRSVHGKMARMA